MTEPKFKKLNVVKLIADGQIGVVLSCQYEKIDDECYWEYEILLDIEPTKKVWISERDLKLHKTLPLIKDGTDAASE